MLQADTPSHQLPQGTGLRTGNPSLFPKHTQHGGDKKNFSMDVNQKPCFYLILKPKARVSPGQISQPTLSVISKCSVVPSHPRPWHIVKAQLETWIGSWWGTGGSLKATTATTASLFSLHGKSWQTSAIRVFFIPFPQGASDCPEVCVRPLHTILSLLQ